MEVAALCIRLLVTVLLLLTAQRADAALLHINSNRLQFFEYESISLNCAGCNGSTDWRVMKKIPSNTTQWETSKESLVIQLTFVTHSGEYWCENAGGERSNTLNITVTAGDVILESPALPVMAGQSVTLRCRKKATTSNSPADFYKDGLFSETGYAGEMTIHNVSMSSEGLYKCKISGAGESPESWLAVRDYIAPAPEATTPQEVHKSTPHPPYHGSIQLSTLLLVVFTISCVAVLLSVVGLLQCRKCKGCQEANAVDYTTDVTYAVVTTKRKEKASAEADVADLGNVTYATVKKRLLAAESPNDSTEEESH
ncbi:Fc receptor-like protein 5 isoform X2 [Epinephelus moara]|uniref:Fc receptor-like protein 5 isoform X2 n=1 Tax=Epinephelus moara TaxID=300413 RepID=UPI00214EBD0C|nr:Fc receptor-like protein 5 isoform X2 [Epinephelus moara]